MSSTTGIVVIVAAVVVVLALTAAAWALIGRRRAARLRDHFGPEYERHLRETGDPVATERELADREKRHRELRLRDFDEAERTDYEKRWEHVQREFVDDPGRAVHDADALVDEVLTARGYPASDRRADDVSVDHPGTVQRFREARRLAGERGDTEDLREAVTSYRALLTALLHGEPDVTDGRKETRA